ncbi:hypothetical protein [Dictyobacter kobayashii]|uniref:Uncharacterized protein n=1 Tax=Dictyobacter kobayashii TaxID=2014872 RepID=A0A402ANZ5_9CHLR|nr:hypothetical protein [Dictyobacter kobayashii]GCE20918.1 hypothetical protein KDK_47180 [Dictyobacter kobayashii]
MSAGKLVFTLQKLYKDSWVAVLGDGIEKAIITASSIPSPPLEPLLWAVRLLLLGASDAKCSWWNEPGEYRWLFVRQREQVLIHIVWFRDIADWSDEKGKTVLRMECDLLSFAKRLFHQLGQLQYRDGDLTIPLDEHQKLQKAIQAFEYANRGMQASDAS